MGRNKKHPEHNPEQLMNELLDNLVGVWTGEKEPELKAVSAELEMSPAKVRKLLITASTRDAICDEWRLAPPLTPLVRYAMMHTSGHRMAPVPARF